MFPCPPWQINQNVCPLTVLSSILSASVSVMTTFLVNVTQKTFLTTCSRVTTLWHKFNLKSTSLSPFVLPFGCSQGNRWPEGMHHLKLRPLTFQPLSHLTQWAFPCGLLLYGTVLAVCMWVHVWLMVFSCNIMGYECVVWPMFITVMVSYKPMFVQPSIKLF